MFVSGLRFSFFFFFANSLFYRADAEYTGRAFKWNEYTFKGSNLTETVTFLHTEGYN